MAWEYGYDMGQEGTLEHLFSGGGGSGGSGALEDRFLAIDPFPLPFVSSVWRLLGLRDEGKEYLYWFLNAPTQSSPNLHFDLESQCF